MTYRQEPRPGVGHEARKNRRISRSRNSPIRRTVLAALMGLILGLTMLPGAARAGQRPVACPGTEAVSTFRIEIARSKTSCEKARAVTREAFLSYSERPVYGLHGIFLGYSCVFGMASTLDFSIPRGPILLCRSWNKYVVASAEPKDPPTNWHFVRAFLDSATASRYSIAKVKTEMGRPWRGLDDRKVDCSGKLGRLQRRCDLSWATGNARFEATFRVRMIPRRWKPAEVRVSGEIRKSGGR